MTALLNSLFGSLSPLWEMSLTAAYVTAVVAVLRLILKKRAPKQVLCVLWLVVFARLLIPVNLESPLSILPDQEQVQAVQDLPAKLAGGQAAPEQNPGQIPAQGQPGGTAANPVSQGNVKPDAPVLSLPGGVTPSAPQDEPQAGFPWQALLAGVWLAGALAMGLYGLVSYLRLKGRLFDAIRAEDGAWEHPSVGSPFILGIIRPRIYLPAGLWGMPRKFILCHERAHLRRLDHIVKPICWAALALHWFNPAAWLAFVLMSRDIEAACDEAVIRRLGPRVKADYSATLLSLATNGRVPAPCPLAFDEGDAKGRIQNVLRYRRPTLWIVVVSAVMAVLAAVCLLTDPVSAKEPDPDPSAPQSQAPEGRNDLLDPWMAEVLSGERRFTRGGDMETEQFTINQLRDMVYMDEHPNLILEVGKLAVMDLDRDGVNEMVVWPTGGEPGDTTEIGYTVGYFIFYRQGDEVKVHYIGWRPMQNLKADGTFNWSSSAWNWGTGRLIDIDTFETEDVTWCDTPTVDDEKYFVDGVKAAKDEFEAAWAAHQAKPEPVWYVFEDGILKYAPINVPIPLDEYAQAAVPDFLDEDQQLLYHQALVMYAHIFGANTEEVDSWPGNIGFNYDYQNPYSPDGVSSYVPATGLYANWADFEEAVLSVFTRDFWNSRNGAGGTDIYINHDGTLFYQPAARGSGGYNDNFPPTFRLVERTDDTISFIMTGYYSDSRPFYGIASDEEIAAWLSAGWEYSIEFPMRMVKTENGWRFDEFHATHTDNGLLDSQMMPNPDAPPPPGTASATPEPSAEPTASAAPLACEHGLEDVRLEYVGGQLAARCNQDDFTYLIPGVTSANWDGATGQSDGVGWMKENVDGDDFTEVLVYTTDDQIVSLKMVNGSPVASSFDYKTLVDDFNQNSTYRLDSENKIMEVSYQGQTKQVTTLDDGYWTYMMTHSGGFSPEISLTNKWVNRISIGFHICNGRGADLGLLAVCTLAYGSDGRLQAGSCTLW